MNVRGSSLAIRPLRSWCGLNSRWMDRVGTLPAGSVARRAELAGSRSPERGWTRAWGEARPRDGVYAPLVDVGASSWSTEFQQVSDSVMSPRVNRDPSRGHRRAPWDPAPAHLCPSAHRLPHLKPRHSSRSLTHHGVTPGVRAASPQSQPL